jgi:hypothetical protein
VNPGQLFKICNLVAASGWLILILAGRRRWAAGIVTGYAIPLVLGTFYTGLVAFHWGKTPGGFGSLDAVASLFTNPWMLLASWVHYLAFDLFIGSWQVRDAGERNIPHILAIPALVVTFLFGPAGLILYFVTRTAYRQIGLNRTR